MTAADECSGPPPLQLHADHSDTAESTLNVEEKDIYSDGVGSSPNIEISKEEEEGEIPLVNMKDYDGDEEEGAELEEEETDILGSPIHRSGEEEDEGQNTMAVSPLLGRESDTELLHLEAPRVQLIQRADEDEEDNTKPSSSDDSRSAFESGNFWKHQEESQRTQSSCASGRSINLKEFADFVPLRLTESERALLAVLESTLNVSEYTDNVDVSIRRGSKARRIYHGILEACHISTGLAICAGRDGEYSLQDSDSANNSLKEGNGKRLARMLKQSSRKKKGPKAARKLKKKKDKRNAKSNASADEPITPSVPDHPTPSAPPASTSTNRSSGSSLASRDPHENEAFFRTLFEIGRRNKVLNPAGMRATYGKLMYLLQDAQSPSVSRSLNFGLHCDLHMVGPYLKNNGCADILHDHRLVDATAHVALRDPATGLRRPRSEIEQQVTMKRNLADALVMEYGLDDGDGAPNQSKRKLSRPEIRRCIDSISDAVAVVEANVAPVERMLRMLEENFHPGKPQPGYSLEIRSSGSSFSSYHSSRFGLSAFGSSPFGSTTSSGPTFSHSHSTQYTFVWQSLKLWCEVQRNMHRLWVCADADLLSSNTSYQLLNTGQGLNRVQSCPRVAKIMRGLLTKTQKAAGAPWVGLSVIHLGDRDVPNALVFIDKYTQIPRFLSPIVDFIDGIDDLCQDKRIENYIESTFESKRNLRMEVLADYFKHGFDGSGDDGGSCIDGRLTSSWNWTSRIAKKNYYHAFMLAGFQGFDGEFK